MLTRVFRSIFSLVVVSILVLATSAPGQTTTTPGQSGVLPATNQQTKVPQPNPQIYRLDTYVNTPHYVDIDEFGRIYILDSCRQVINRYNACGKLEKQWAEGIHSAGEDYARTPLVVAPGERILLGPGAFTYNIRCIGPNPGDDRTYPVSMSCVRYVMPGKDGTFFIHEQFRNEKGLIVRGEIQKYAKDGKRLDSWEIAHPQCYYMGQDGLIYVKHDGHPELEVWDQDGKPLRKIDMSSIFETWQWDRNCNLWVDYNGDIYFTWDYSVYRVDKDGNLLSKWRFHNLNSTQVVTVKRGLIYAMSYDGKGRTGLAEKWPWELEVYNSAGQILIRYQNAPKPDFELPIMTAVQPDGWNAVIHQGYKQAELFDPAGERHDFSPACSPMYILSNPKGGFLTSHGGVLVTHDGHGANPTVIYPINPAKGFLPNMQQSAYDPVSGDLWGLGWSGKLTHMKPDGQIIKEFPRCDPLCFKTWSVGMVIDHKGFIYVPNAYGHCVVKSDQNGNIISRIGKKGSGLGELMYPEGLALDAKDRLYVADSGNSRIQVFDTDGKSLGFYGKRGKGDGEFDRPYGVTIAPDNKLWVADTFNDRIVKIPLTDLWKQLNLEVKPEPLVLAPKRQPIPVAGKVTVVGVIVAGTDDFSDVVYLEDGYRAWAIEASLPAGKQLKRGAKCNLTGTLTVKARTPKHLDVDTVEITEPSVRSEETPAPLGMTNQYVGDGYRNGDKPVDLSNLAMLITTWGKVIEVNEQDKLFVINDGTYKTGGLVVKVDNTTSGSFVWPKVDQYVRVTGISISYSDSEGSIWSGLRIRSQSDVAVIQE